MGMLKNTHCSTDAAGRVAGVEMHKGNTWIQLECCAVRVGGRALRAGAAGVEINEKITHVHTTSTARRTGGGPAGARHIERCLVHTPV